MNENDKNRKKLFTMRMDGYTREKLQDLASTRFYKYNKSAVVKSLIEAAYRKKSNKNVPY